PRHVSQQVRVAIAVTCHQAAHLSAARQGRRCGQQRPALEVQAVSVAREREEVVPVPDRVDTHILGAANGVGECGVRGMLRVQLHPYADTRQCAPLFHMQARNRVLSMILQLILFPSAAAQSAGIRGGPRSIRPRTLSSPSGALHIDSTHQLTPASASACTLAPGVARSLPASSRPPQPTAPPLRSRCRTARRAPSTRSSGCAPSRPVVRQAKLRSPATRAGRVGHSPTAGTSRYRTVCRTARAPPGPLAPTCASQAY